MSHKNRVLSEGPGVEEQVTLIHVPHGFVVSFQLSVGQFPRDLGPWSI